VDRKKKEERGGRILSLIEKNIKKRQATSFLGQDKRKQP